MIWDLRGATADDDSLLPESTRRCFAPGAAHTGVLFDAYPGLRDRLTERDDLLPLSDDVRLEPAWLTHRAHHVRLHPGFQLRLRGRINDDLTHSIRAAVDQKLPVSVAIDPSRVSDLGTLQRTVALDGWFGAAYDRTKLQDLQHVGSVVHQRPYDVGHTQKAGLRCDVRWTADGTSKNFEIEELPVLEIVDQLQGQVVYCRFLHAIYDTKRRCFTHADGAIAIYSRETYRLRRLASDSHHIPKVWADTKIKIFRIDASSSIGISVELWEQLVTTFFRGNELPLEYLSGRSFEEIYRDEYGHEHPFIVASRRAAGA